MFKDCLFGVSDTSALGSTQPDYVVGGVVPTGGYIIMDDCGFAGYDSSSAASWDAVPVTNPVGAINGGKGANP